MRWKEWLKNDNGFSLIEVILAVAVLALVTLPIINYFTYSALRTVDGREKQSATMAGENVIDELNSYSNFEQIESLASGGAWSVNNSDPDFTKMQRSVTVNNVDYLADVRIGYKEYDTDTETVSGAAIDYEYNDFEVPQPSEVYSSSNVVAAEDDEKDLGLSDLYTSTGASVPKTMIANAMSRIMCIDVKYKDSVLKDIYTVNVYYRYTYDSHSSDVILEQTNIRVNKLKNIFLFYNLLRDDITNEAFAVNFADDIPNEAISDIKIYLAAQKTDSVIRPVSYSLEMATSMSSANAKLAQYYTNSIDAGNFDLAKKDDGSADDFVPKNTKKRIGAIDVDIYDPGDTSLTKALAHLHTTISE